MTSPEETSTEELLDRVAVLNAESKRINDELTSLKAEVRRRMKVGDYADFTASDGASVRLSLQSGGSKFTYDMAAFQSELEPALFAEITVTSIDDDLLYEAVSNNRIPQRLLEAPYITEKKGTPRVVITRTRNTAAE